ncbi:MAG: hypothetical protein H6767_10050 [Candidatus Peribacteria bacterium]|nr:MAG: hypothetical protein H6767_10050 [Candidatus Peribacteria bacterium]
MYNHTLLGGGATKTIESVVLGSNEHLKKFAYSSKIPAVQTTQNFQLGLSNLNLPDIFHMSFDISKKPVPILNVEKTTPEHSQKDDMLSSDSMLREYYKSMSLDYERRNSMIRYTSSEEELKTITESAGLTPTTIEEKLNTLKKIQAIEAKRIELLSKTIDAKTQAKELAVFDNDLMHLQLFADNLAAHAEQIQAIIKKMVDIKIRHND